MLICARAVIFQYLFSLGVFGVTDDMVRNSSYNGYGQYFVNKSSCVTARRSSDSDWIKVNKKSRLTNKHPFTSDYISNLKDVSDVETRFPLEFLYDSDENESDDDDDDTVYNFESEPISMDKVTDSTSEPISMDNVTDSTSVHMGEYEFDNATEENLQYTKKNLDGMYLDDEGDQIPDLRENNEEVQSFSEKDYLFNLNLMTAIGTRVAKQFDQGVFAGTVTKYLAPNCGDDYPLWQTVFDDNDTEQWNITELEHGISLFNSEVTFSLHNFMDNERSLSSCAECDSMSESYCVSNTDTETSVSDDNSERCVESADDDSDFEYSSSGESCISVSS